MALITSPQRQQERSATCSSKWGRLPSWVLLLLMVVSASLVVMFRPQDNPSTLLVSTSTSASSDCEPGVIYRVAGLPPLKDRTHIGQLLEARGFTDGAEVGVKFGEHANILLSNWKSCKSFQLVDLWEHQENYIDASNTDSQQQERTYQAAVNKLEKWSHKTTFHRMLSTEAAQKMATNSLDFVYVDARHDYCGVREDMEVYWPKLRPGAIMAGHDFLYAREVPKKLGDWSICGNESVNPGSVRGAVQEFAEKHGLVVTVMYGEKSFWTWMVQKPTKNECVKESSGQWLNPETP